MAASAFARGLEGVSPKAILSKLQLTTEMIVLSLLVGTALVASGQAPSSAAAQTDSLSQQRQQFYQAISSQISPEIKARVNIRAKDYFDTDWRANDDNVTGETYIFPAGHADRIYITGVNPGWNAEQNIIYQSVTCLSQTKGAYAAVWTIDWRETQNATAPDGLTGLAKLLQLDPQRIDNKFIRDELTRVRGYALYKKSDTSKPWTSEFYDDQGNRAGTTADDKGMYLFTTLQQEQDYLKPHN